MLYKTTFYLLAYFPVCLSVTVQGPALYAYNNALFDDEDWRGIRMLSQSIKHSDPLKVGHFGIGFKSVFHLTGKNNNNNTNQDDIYSAVFMAEPL